MDTIHAHSAPLKTGEQHRPQAGGQPSHPPGSFCSGKYFQQVKAAILKLFCITVSVSALQIVRIARRWACEFPAR
ncbi:hypothetical protein MPTK2_1g16020 [Marchantia polymorpha subsp. ruderalis]